MALTQWQLKPVATDSIVSGDFLIFSDESETGDPINKLTIDSLATFLAGGANLSASAGVLTATDTDTNTTYTGGTNLTLAGTVFNVDDSFLINSGSDVTAGTITMAHLIIGDGGNIGSASDTNAISIASGGKVTFSQGFAVGSDAAGDMLYHNGTSYVRLAKGSADEVLTMNDGETAPGWEAAAAGGASTGTALAFAIVFN